MAGVRARQNVAVVAGRWVLAGLALLLFLSLISYSAFDNAWSRISIVVNDQTAVSATANWCGRCGAWLADLLLSFLGSSAYAVPAALLFISLGGVDRVVTSGNHNNDNYNGEDDGQRTGLIQLLAIVSLLLLASALESSLSFQPLRLPMGPGGVFGHCLWASFVVWFGLVGGRCTLLWLIGLELIILTGNLLYTLSKFILIVFFYQIKRGRQMLSQVAAACWRLGGRMRRGLMEQTRLLVLLRRAWQTLKAMPWSCTHQSPPVAAAPLTVTADTPSQLDKVAEERVLAAQMPAAISQQSQCDLLNEDEQLELEQLAALEVAVQLEAEAKLEETMQPEEVSPLQLDETLLTELDAAPVQTAAIEAIAKEDISEIGTAPTAEFGDPAVVTDNRPWQFPSLELLESSTHSAADSKLGYTQDELRNLSRLVESKLLDFGVKAQVVGAQPGPVITRFELELSAGTKVSKITGLAKDLARSLSVLSVRVVEVIPGKSVIGVELPNRYREIVRLRELLVAHEFQESRCKLALALGKGIAGEPVIVDLTKMPHLLVAGTTGSGKSVCINALLLSLLYKYTPDQLRLILIDPKMLELSVYSGIPHLLAPVIVDMKEATGVFRWCVAEMEHRYRLMAALGVRNLSGFNDYLQAAQERHEVVANPLWDGEGSLEPRELQPLPYLVVIADEYADMLMVVGKKIEELIARLAQKARAAGIHLILATQRPSVDVVTGLIKANIPTRIAFQVSSRIDSRTILDQSGAEQLLGAGDMLYLPIGSGVPIRVHGAFVDDNEVHRVVNAMKAVVAASLVDHSASTHGVSPNHMLGASSTTNSSSHYPMLDPQQLQQEEEREQLLLDGAGHGGGSRGCNSDDNEHDELYDQAVDWVLSNQRVSISSLQRRFRIGYNRAARIVESMEAAGLVGAMEGSGGTRRVLVQRESTATAEE